MKEYEHQETCQDFLIKNAQHIKYSDFLFLKIMVQKNRLL